MVESLGGIWTIFPSVQRNITSFEDNREEDNFQKHMLSVECHPKDVADELMCKRPEAIGKRSHKEKQQYSDFGPQKSVLLHFSISIFFFFLKSATYKTFSQQIIGGQLLLVQGVYGHFFLVFRGTLLTLRITGKKIISRSIC